MTTAEIAAEHGVSRQTIHTYRRTGVFPQPVEGEGSTRPRFREDEVTAFFAANPKQPGKRTDLPSRDEGAAMPPKTEQAARAVDRPDYLTEAQWSAFAFETLAGVVKGVIEAGMRPGWDMELATAALKGARARLDELVAEEASDG